MSTFCHVLSCAALRCLPLVALAAAFLGTGCGSSSTSLVAPTGQKCQISVSGFTGAFGPSGGSGSATIEAARECSWSASTQAQWIALPSGASGTGSGTLSFTVLPNTAPRARTGALAVNTQNLTVSQEPAPCRFNVSPLTLTLPAAGGSGSVSVAASDGSCSWSAASQAPWLSVTSAGAANGNGGVTFVAAANLATVRSGTLLVAGQEVTVTQAAPAPTPAPPPPGSPPPTPPAPGPTAPVQVEGEVSGRRGDCPTVTFFVQGIAIATTADTEFVNAPCNKVKNGTQVRVDGVQQAGQPVVAVRVTTLED